MKRSKAEPGRVRAVRWPSFYVALLLMIAILIASATLWVRNTQSASVDTVNDLCRFYLEEITERNTDNITSELEGKARQMQQALKILDADYLQNEESVRRYIGMMQKITGLDMFALVDADGMVYTADSTFSGISRFSFLSDEITREEIHMVKSYGTRTMIILASPVETETAGNIRVVSCFTGLNIESVISAEQLKGDENKTHCRLFTKGGKNLLTIEGDFPNRKNLFTVWEEVASFAPGYSLEAVREDWENGREGYTVYSTQSAGNSYVYYKTVPGTDLILTSLMRESNINEVVNAGTRKMLNTSLLFLIAVVLTLMSLYSMVMIMMRGVRKRQQENEQFRIVGALSNDYSDIFLMAPLQDKASVMKRNGQMVDYAHDAPRSYREIWKRFEEWFVLPEDARMVARAVAAQSVCERLKEEPEFTLDFRAKPGDELHYYQMKLARIDAEDARFIVGFRNTDAQKRAEIERQKVLQDALASAQHANRAKTTFLNNMSHDIRTPMNAIIGYTTLAASHVDHPEQIRNYLSKIQTAGSHLMSLINDVLDMSRIESGKVKIAEQQVHLPDLIHDLRTIVQADINAKQLEFFIDTVDVVNEDVICDRLRLSQILLNLLSNAMKFTRPGGTVSLRIIQTPSAAKEFVGYEFRVKDTGIGMSQEFQEHIFEAFTREHSSTDSGIQGTGLGMAITKSIVDIMGGTIRVRSEVDKGSEFVVRLQFRIGGKAVKNEPIPELQGLRALVADDDVNTCMSISSMLGVIGMRSEWTTSGKEAVVRAQFAIQQCDEFHAYIIDWLMPDMNGIEVVRRIRRIIGDSKPIIVLTAYDWAGIEEEAREAGVTGFCSKPLFMSELREVLTRPFAPQTQKQEPEDVARSFEGVRLLLVEDNALNQEIAMEILRGMGFSMELASNGEEAVEIMRAAAPGQYDLILMDIQMPHMDGYEATRQIRRLPNADVANIPIIAMTANAFAEDRQNAFEAGMNGHIAKPIDVEKLTRLLTEMLK